MQSSRTSITRKLSLNGLGILVMLGLVWLSNLNGSTPVAKADACGTIANPPSDRVGNYYSEQSGLAAIDSARAQEGIGPITTRLPANYNSSNATNKVLILLNLERQDRGITPFSQNNLVLAQTSFNHSQILNAFNIFAHNDAVDGTFGTRVTAAPGIPNHWSSAGEIIAGNSFVSGMVWEWMYDDAEQGWGHRVNILGCFNTVGVGYAVGGPYGAVATVDFIQANSSYQPPTTVDTTPPSLTINPSNFNSNLSGTLNVSATATDSGSGMRHVAFFVDGQGFDGSKVPTFTVSGSTYSKSFTGVSKGSHTLTAVAVDQNNNYVRADATILDGAMAPNAPTALAATSVSTSQINLAWTNNATNQTGFELQRSTDQTNWTSLSTAATSYQDTGRAAGTLYYYRVRAGNANGNSTFSNIASAATMLPAPTNLAASLGATYNVINLSWTDNSTNESGFEVQRKANTSDWIKVATANANATTYQDTNALPGTSYSYRIRAVNAVATSAFSNSTATVTTPQPPTGATVTNSQDQGAAIDGNTVGTLSYALLHTPANQAIIFSVSNVSVTAALPDPANSNVSLNPAGNCASPVTITYSGSAATTVDGLHLMNGMYLKAITVQHFTGVQLKASSGGGNRTACVKAIK